MLTFVVFCDSPVTQDGFGTKKNAHEVQFGRISAINVRWKPSPKRNNPNGSDKRIKNQFTSTSESGIDSNFLEKNVLNL